MVDVIIEPAATAASQFMRQSCSQIGPVDVGDNRYVFYIWSDGEIIDYKKSTDKGATYGAAVTIYDGTATPTPIKKFAIWFDQWTDGDTGSIIHMVYLGAGAGPRPTEYIALDTDDDSLTAPVDFVTFGAVSGTVGWVGAGRSALTITKSRTGRLHVMGWLDNGAGDGFHSVSTDGITWDDTRQTLQDVGEGNNAFKLLAVPGNNPATEDIWCIMMDPALVVKVRSYDFSLDGWAAANTISNVATNSDIYFQMSVTERFSDNQILLAFWTDFNAAGADLELWQLHTPSSFTQLTDVETNFNNSLDCTIMIDQVTDELRVYYMNGTPTVTVSVYERVSLDGGLTWAAAAVVNEDVPDDHRLVRVPPMQSITGGRFMPIWRNDDLADIVTNFNNAVEVGGTPTEPPPGPPEIVPPGGTYGPAPGAPPGSIVYIVPDVIPGEPPIEYPLVTPHRTGRFVMNFSGFGMAPIQYISQRGPNQDGETVRDFNLTPRVVQLLERQQFKGREAWWDGRADILNDLRPNRQATATAVVTGTLRMVRADGSLRDLNVFIQEGPRFEARNVDEWDEWAFEEVLRFIAHDPLFFDPTRVDFALAFTLDANLVFPITFPIQFGGGAIDTTFNLDYTGTWASLPTIVIVGPLDNPIIDNVTTGETIALQRNIGPGRTVTIDLAFGQKTITDDLGANLLGSLTTDSDLGTWHIAPTPEAPQVVGQPRPTARNVIRLRGSNPTGSTSVQVRYFTRFVGI